MMIFSAFLFHFQKGSTIFHLRLTLNRCRIQCDNTRPECLRCKKSSRECKGYEKRALFIYSGLEHEGRCSLQPPRKVARSSRTKQERSSSKAKPSYISKKSPSIKSLINSLLLEFGPGDEVCEQVGGPANETDFIVDPLQSAWDDFVKVTEGNTTCLRKIVAFHTQLEHVKQYQFSGPSNAEQTSYVIHTPTLSTPDMNTRASTEADFGARCDLYLSQSDTIYDILGTQTESYCLFLYEVCTIVYFATNSPTSTS